MKLHKDETKNGASPCIITLLMDSRKGNKILRVDDEVWNLESRFSVGHPKNKNIA